MHPQIKTVIDSIRVVPAGIAVTLTSGEHTPLGEVLRRMYYSMDEFTSLIESVGFPNNGGLHTFSYQGNAKDFVAYLELLQDEMRARFRMTDDVKQVVSELDFVIQEILKD